MTIWTKAAGIPLKDVELKAGRYQFRYENVNVAMMQVPKFPYEKTIAGKKGIIHDIRFTDLTKEREIDLLRFFRFQSPVVTVTRATAVVDFELQENPVPALLIAAPLAIFITGLGIYLSTENLVEITRTIGGSAVGIGLAFIGVLAAWKFLR